MSVIEVKNLCKRFTIDIKPLTMFNLFKRILKPEKHHIEILALKNINFEVDRGDRVGLIGDNGSGKTTLLKVLAGLYKKTEGLVAVRGKLAAFLQLGIGMERNLSALENIFLFGAIMGMKRKEIHKNLDDIVEFAEIEEFLYCPLRDFSTGMVQRMAFSIARYVQCEILLLDEMLVSGDIRFREKCYNAFENYVDISRTIMVTSHEIELIKKFCNKALLLDRGDQVAFGPVGEVLNLYLKGSSGKP